MDIQFSIETAKTLLNQSPVGTLLFNDTGELVWANDKLVEILATTPDSIVTMTAGDIQGRFTKTADDVYQLANSPAFYQIISRDITDQQHKYQAWFITDVSDAESVRQANQGLRKRVNEFAMLDPDTGLLTYPALLQNLELLVTRSRRYSNPLSLLKVDVRCATEQVPMEALLTAVGHMLKDQMRWADLISRGDDGRFIIIMPETPIDSVVSLVDKIRQNLLVLEIPFAGNKKCNVAANFGLTAWGRGDDASLLLDRLDQALNGALASADEDLVRL